MGLLFTVLSIAAWRWEFRGRMEAKSIITLKQMLAQMEAAVEPFALRYVKYNEQKGTGGELVAISGQLLSGKGKAEPAPLVGQGPEKLPSVE